MVNGNTIPGNRSVLRTGMMINASAGTGRAGAVARVALSSEEPRNSISATQRSRFLQRDQEAAVAGASLNRAVAPAWQPQAALEATLRQLQTVNDCGAQLGREHARSSNN